jgi:hypothetical protein
MNIQVAHNEVDGFGKSPDAELKFGTARLGRLKPAAAAQAA